MRTKSSKRDLEHRKKCSCEYVLGEGFDDALKKHLKDEQRPPLPPCLPPPPPDSAASPAVPTLPPSPLNIVCEEYAKFSKFIG